MNEKQKHKNHFLKYNLKGDFYMKTSKRLKLGIIIISFILIGNTNIVLADLEDNQLEMSANEIHDQVIQTTTKINNEPKLDARVAVIYDRASGRMLYQKNGEKQTPMASTTKIMTAIVVMENANLSDVVTIEAKAAGTGGSRLGLKKNDKITVNDLLYGLMLRSGNDAAVALAIHVGGSVPGFAELMNEKAKQLELANTHFVLPHGLDRDGHYTTAYELAKITDYALRNETIKQIVSTKTTTIYINGYSKTINNTNELLGNLNGVYGVKTGFTNGAGRCLVTACKRDKLDIITVVLGADTKKIRTTDSIKLIEYAYKNYQMIEIKNKIEEEFQKWKEINQGRIIIEKGNKKKVELEIEEIEYEKIAVKNTQIDNIHLEINSLFYLQSPIEKNQIIGNVKVMIGEETINILNIYAKEEIRKKNVTDYLLEFLALAS